MIVATAAPNNRQTARRVTGGRLTKDLKLFPGNVHVLIPGVSVKVLDLWEQFEDREKHDRYIGLEFR